MPSARRMRAVYYRDRAGREPVREFIGALRPAAKQAKIRLQVDRLNMLTEKDPPLPFPHSSQIEGELRELRCHYGNDLYRVLYRRSEILFVLLHILEKNTGDIPEEDKVVARRRWDDFRARMDSPPPRRPRPGGSDAP
jgi:phage-related protein